MKSFGNKGRKKRYIPSFDLQHNPYLVLSETFHFATKILSKKIPEEMGGDWGNKLLKIVNVNKIDEFGPNDMYGLFIRQYNSHGNITDDFLHFVSDSVSRIICDEIVIDWSS